MFTALALALINLGLAVLIVFAIGLPTITPLWLGVIALLLGIAAAAYAVLAWRTVLRPRRDF